MYKNPPTPRLRRIKQNKMDIVSKIEANKTWGYVAIGAAVIAAVGIAITVKEVWDAKKLAEATTNFIGDEYKSGCCGGC